MRLIDLHPGSHDLTHLYEIVEGDLVLEASYYRRHNVWLLQSMRYGDRRVACFQSSSVSDGAFLEWLNEQRTVLEAGKATA